MKGGNGKDELLDGQGADVLRGGKGDDDLSGNRGADTLRGGKGDDTLQGGKGDDVVKGGRGNDSLTGGDGEDEFFFKAGADEIVDFEDDIDTIVLNSTKLAGSVFTVAEVEALSSVSGGSLVIDFGSGHTLTVAGVTDFAVVENDLLII